MSETASWCVESPITNSYVATACPYDHDPQRETRDKAAQQLKIATHAFIERVEYDPLRLEALDFTAVSAWQGLAGQLTKRYVNAHWELVNGDDSYREALGNAFDAYRPTNSTRGRGIESAQKKRRRQITDVHEKVKEAASEGIPTVVAAYGVVPRVVKLRRPYLSYIEQVALCTELLPATTEFARTLARHSKRGDARLLHGITKPAQIGLINYARLTYDEAAFDVTIDERQRSALQLVEDHFEPKDTETRFRGCDALLYGSVGTLNRLIVTTVIDHALYERSLSPINKRVTARY